MQSNIVGVQVFVRWGWKLMDVSHTLGTPSDAPNDKLWGRRRIITAYQPEGPCNAGMEVGEGSGRSWRRGEEQTRAETENGGDGEQSRVHERL